MDGHGLARRMPTVDMEMLNGCSRWCVTYSEPLTWKCRMYGHGRAWPMPTVDIEILNGCSRLCVANAGP